MLVDKMKLGRFVTGRIKKGRTVRGRSVGYRQVNRQDFTIELHKRQNICVLIEARQEDDARANKN